jgi:integrase
MGTPLGTRWTTSLDRPGGAISPWPGYRDAGIEGAGRDLHSLRTTFSSIAADAGYSEIIVAALLGHRVADGVTARYIHPDRDPLHQAADVTSATIAAALQGRKAAEIVPIDRSHQPVSH